MNEPIPDPPKKTGHEGTLVLLRNGGGELTPEEEVERDQLAQQVPDETIALIGLLNVAGVLAKVIVKGESPTEEEIGDLWNVADLAFRSLKLGQRRVASPKKKK